MSRRQVIMHHHMMLTPNQIFALKSRWAKEQLRQTATIARQQQGSFDPSRMMFSKICLAWEGLH